MSTKTSPAPGIPCSGSQARHPARDRSASRLSVPRLSVVLTVAVGVSASHLPPPPLTGGDLGTWAGELGPTAAAFALIRVVLVVLALRLWATLALVALVRSLPRARSVRRLVPLAEAVGGRIARDWVRAALGVGVASTLLIPSTAAATETTAVEAPLLERIEDEGDTGPLASPSPPASDKEDAGRRGPGTDPPRLVLVDPPFPEPTSTSPSDPSPHREGAPGGRERGGAEPGRSERSPSTVPLQGPVRHGQAPGEDPGGGAPHIPTGDGTEHGRRPGRSPAAGPSTSRDASADPDHAGPPPWTISPGEHLWHVAEATAAELAPGATTAEVAEYHRRLVAANAANLPVPGNPDLVFSGNVIVRPAWVPPA